jgi:hypothetical protein
MIDPTALAAELSADPMHAGYAAPLAAGADGAVAALLNATTGPGAGALVLSFLAKNDFLIATSVVAVRLAIGIGADGQTTLADVVKAKWTAALDQARSADPGSSIDLAVIQMLGDPVADGVLSTDELAKLKARTGSRAEVLFGAGSIVDHNDVSRALGNLGKIVGPPAAPGGN